MVKTLNKDILSLSIASKVATAEDLQSAQDLLDTLNHYRESCVGMAANMIGVHKRIIVFYDENQKKNRVMFNPEIIMCKEEYTTEEGCLCLQGVRSAKRFKTIKVAYQNEHFETKQQTFHDFTAQIIQHEFDMTNGILI